MWFETLQCGGTSAPVFLFRKIEIQEIFHPHFDIFWTRLHIIMCPGSVASFQWKLLQEVGELSLMEKTAGVKDHWLALGNIGVQLNPECFLYTEVPHVSLAGFGFVHVLAGTLKLGQECFFFAGNMTRGQSWRRSGQEGLWGSGQTADDPAGRDLVFLSLSCLLVCRLHANVQLLSVFWWKQEQKTLMVGASWFDKNAQTKLCKQRQHNLSVCVCVCVSHIRLYMDACCINVEKTSKNKLLHFLFFRRTKLRWMKA